MIPRFHISRLRLLNPSRSVFQKCGTTRWGTKAPFRWTSTTAQPSKVTGKKTQFPERLLIYHAGTTRTVFLGCLKVTTIFIFAFFSLVVAPTHFYSENEPKWISAAVLLSGTVPLVAVFYITQPFVNYIHLRLPTFARNSKELLIRYSKALPSNAEIDLTTMNIVGKPRVVRMKVTDLKRQNERFGLVNYVRDRESKEVGKKRPWWMGKKASKFGVHDGRTKIMGGEIWSNVRGAIDRRRS